MENIPNLNNFSQSFSLSKSLGKLNIYFRTFKQRTYISKLLNSSTHFFDITMGLKNVSQGDYSLIIVRTESEIQKSNPFLYAKNCYCFLLSQFSTSTIYLLILFLILSLSAQKCAYENIYAENIWRKSWITARLYSQNYLNRLTGNLKIIQ